MVGEPGVRRGYFVNLRAAWRCGVFEREISFRKRTGARGMLGEMGKSEKYFLFFGFEAILGFEKCKGKDISDMNRVDGWLTELGTALRENRKAYQLTQEELGELVGVSDRTVRDVELGTGKASFSTVLELLSAVGLRVEVVNA